MKRSEKVSLLAKISLFADLPQPELEHLAVTLQPHEFAQGTLMMRENESDEFIYILLDGEVEVIKALGTSDERLLVIRPPGTLFGEMSLFDPQGSHTASVRAHTPAYVLEMTRQDFDRLLHHYPTLVYEMEIAEGTMERAALLLGATDAYAQRFQWERTPKERAMRAEGIDCVCAALGETAFEAIWNEGRKLTLEQVVEYARGWGG